MPIIYVKGDLTKAKESVIGHGVNIRGAMGSGVALALMTKWPEIRRVYMHIHKMVGWQLGDVQFVPCEDKIIANCATQKDYLPRGVRHADYEAIEEVMQKLYKYCVTGNYSLAIPKIGAGLAGGDWSIIEKIINKVFTDRDIFVYHLD